MPPKWVLQVELMRQRISNASGAVTRRLTDLSRPVVDWVALAKGLGVPASAAGTCEEFAAQLRAALARPGPYLIQAQLA